MKDKERKRNNIGTIIVIVMFVLCISYIVMSTINAKKHKLFYVFDYTFAVVPTNSMEKTIMTDDIIIIKNVSFDDVDVDDIIVYYNSSKNINIVHRIIERYPDGSFLTKGDNNSSDDGIPITKDIYLGKVVANTKALGLGKLINNNRSLLFLAIIIVIIYLLVCEFINIIKITKEKENEKFNLELENRKKQIKEEVQKELENELLDNGKTKEI